VTDPAELDHLVAPRLAEAGFDVPRNQLPADDDPTSVADAEPSSHRRQDRRMTITAIVLAVITLGAFVASLATGESAPSVSHVFLIVFIVGLGVAILTLFAVVMFVLNGGVR
jgi:hypothetical protein